MNRSAKYSSGHSYPNLGRSVPELYIGEFPENMRSPYFSAAGPTGKNMFRQGIIPDFSVDLKGGALYLFLPLKVALFNSSAPPMLGSDPAIRVDPIAVRTMACVVTLTRDNMIPFPL